MSGFSINQPELSSGLSFARFDDWDSRAVDSLSPPAEHAALAVLRVAHDDAYFLKQPACFEVCRTQAEAFVVPALRMHSLTPRWIWMDSPREYRRTDDYWTPARLAQESFGPGVEMLNEHIVKGLHRWRFSAELRITSVGMGAVWERLGGSCVLIWMPSHDNNITKEVHECALVPSHARSADDMDADLSWSRLACWCAERASILTGRPRSNDDRLCRIEFAGLSEQVGALWRTALESWTHHVKTPPRT